jgi:hypothetical protein
VDSVGFVYGPVEVCCECGDEPAGFVARELFIIMLCHDVKRYKNSVTSHYAVLSTSLSEMSLFKLFVKFIKYVMFGVLTALKSILRFCVTTQCGFVGCYRRFGEIIASILHAKYVPNIYIQRTVIRIR